MGVILTYCKAVNQRQERNLKVCFVYLLLSAFIHEAIRTIIFRPPHQADLFVIKCSLIQTIYCFET